MSTLDAGPLRVLYVHPFAQAVSGPDESLLVLLRSLGARIAPTVALPPDSPFRSQYLAAGAQLVEQPISRIRRGRTPRELAAWARELATSTARLLAATRHARPQLVHANMEVCLEAGLVARALRVPCIFHYRGNTNDDPKRVFDVLVRTWTTLGDHVFAISRGCARIFETRGRGAHVEVLYNALELERFTSTLDREATRISLGLASSDVAILTVGRIHPRKDLATLVRAAALATRESKAPLRFLVVGGADGADEERYQAELRTLAANERVASRFTWLGARSDVPRLLGAADAFVMTSRNEGFGRSAAEAMAAGLPVVLTNEGAYPELVEAGVHGLLAQAGNAAHFAAGILQLTNDSKARAAMGAAARRRAIARYDARRQADRVFEVYRALSAGQRPAPPSGEPG